MLQSNYVINHHEKQSQQIPGIDKRQSYTHIFLKLCVYIDIGISHTTFEYKEVLFPYIRFISDLQKSCVEKLHINCFMN